MLYSNLVFRRFAMKNELGNEMNDRGSSILEGIFAALLISLGIVLYFNATFNDNAGRQLGNAKNLALKQAQIAGGLTTGIRQSVIDSLTIAGFNTASISVTSPQTAPVPYGTEIEINITATTNARGGFDALLRPTNSVHTRKAQGFIISQYSP